MNYDSLNEIYLKRNSVTRNKILPNVKNKKEKGKRNYNNSAIDTYNKLPINIKTLNGSTEQIKKVLKNWIKINLNQIYNILTY